MSDNRPERWEIWSVMMEPHMHPAIVLDVTEDRLVVIPITSSDTFAPPAQRMAMEPADDDFGATGLRAQISYACPTGVLVADVADARMKHGYLTPFYVDILMQLLSDPAIAAIVRKRWSR